MYNGDNDLEGGLKAMANDSAGAEKEKKGRHRSANFPSISLDRSIMIVRALYEKYTAWFGRLWGGNEGLNISPQAAVRCES